MRIDIDWSLLDGNGEDDAWGSSFCLYAYLHPTRDWLMYVGKCDTTTVRQRWHGEHKRTLFGAIKRMYGVDSLRVMQGRIYLPEGKRRSSALLADAESLLIKRLQPFGNIQSKKSRIERPGLIVVCAGDWPFKRSRFIDQ